MVTRDVWHGMEVPRPQVEVGGGPSIFRPIDFDVELGGDNGRTILYLDVSAVQRAQSRVTVKSLGIPAQED
jgi:hypothetical protein